MRNVKQDPEKRKTTVKRGNRNVRKQKRLDWKKLLIRAMRLFLGVCCTVLIVIGAALLVKVVVDSDFFAVKTINVSGNKHLTVQDVIDLSDIRHGVSTFDLDLEMIGQKLAENDWIRSAHIMRKLPQGVVINIIEHNARFIINLDYLYYVDDAGEIFKVLRRGDQLDFPLITGIDRQQLLAQPQVVTKRLRYIAEMIDELDQRKYFNLDCVAQINVEAKGCYTLYTDPLGVPIHVGDDHFGEKIDRLEQIFSDVKRRLPALAYIDLSVPDEVIMKMVSQPN
ncbi:MAG: hypothetical protein B6I36_07510 [Desulfobacteraceae bacterium 4572_35.1]|nr:MAG: hypothetical protein B6I36_07510 [Desulfobacteraceae bacterium 4572_35.1]